MTEAQLAKQIMEQVMETDYGIIGRVKRVETWGRPRNRRSSYRRSREGKDENL